MAEGSKEHGSSVPARGTIHLLVARTAFMAIGFVVSIILARALGKAAFGVYGVLLSVLVWVELAAGAGIQAATARMMHDSRRAARVVEQTSIVLSTVVALVAFAALWMLAPVVAAALRIEEGTLLFRLAILDLPLAGLYSAYQGILNGQRKFGTLGVAFVLYGLAKLASILILLAVGVSVRGALIANVGSTVGVLVFLIARDPPRLVLPPRGELGVMGRMAFLMGTYLMIFQVLLNLDLWLLKGLWEGGEDVIGLYVAALNLGRALLVVPSALSGVLFASMARALAHGDRDLAHHHVQAAARFALVVLAPACGLLAVHAEEIMTLVYSGKYAGSGAYLALIVFVYALAGFLDVFCLGLMAAGLEKRVAFLTLAVIPLAVVANRILIPVYGPVGAASAALAAVSLATLVIGWVLHARFGSPLRAATLVRVVIAVAIVAAAGAWIPATGFLLLVELAALGLGYLGLLFLLGELRARDVRAVLPW